MNALLKFEEIFILIYEITLTLGIGLFEWGMKVMRNDPKYFYWCEWLSKHD